MGLDTMNIRLLNRFVFSLRTLGLGGAIEFLKFCFTNLELVIFVNAAAACGKNFGGPVPAASTRCGKISGGPVFALPPS